jgi:hypothetical protein
LPPNAGDYRRAINLWMKMPLYCESGSSPAFGRAVIKTPQLDYPVITSGQ